MPSGPRFSSSATKVKISSPLAGPPRRAISSASQSWTAMLPLQLPAPSPWTSPPLTSALKGSLFQLARSPTPTVSTWALKAMVGPLPLPFIRATTLSTPLLLAAISTL